MVIFDSESCIEREVIIDFPVIHEISIPALGSNFIRAYCGLISSPEVQSVVAHLSHDCCSQLIGTHNAIPICIKGISSCIPVIVNPRKEPFIEFAIRHNAFIIKPSKSNSH